VNGSSTNFEIDGFGDGTVVVCQRCCSFLFLEL